MARTWYPLDKSLHVQYGLDLSLTSQNGIAYLVDMNVIRWDQYATDNSSSLFSEVLDPDPLNGVGRWSGISWGSGSGTRVVDTFLQRLYPCKASAYNVSLEIAVDSAFATYYNGAMQLVDIGNHVFTFTIPAASTPSAPSNLTATRVNDNRIDLSWTNGSGYATEILVERSVDDGEWSVIDSIQPGSTSYSDTYVLARHVFKYRVRAYNSVKYSSYSNATPNVYTSPTKPYSISVKRTGSSSILVSLDNPVYSATSLEWQYSSDGQSWSNGGTVQGRAETFYASLQGAGYIRVRNVNSIASSDWLKSSLVPDVTRPLPPTPISPAHGETLSSSSRYVRFEWKYNSVDGSDQNRIQIAMSKDGGAWETLHARSNDSDPYCDIDTSVILGVAQSASIEWKIRASGDSGITLFSNYSASRIFGIVNDPTLSISSPSSTVSSFPFIVDTEFDDGFGRDAVSATISIFKGSSLVSEKQARIGDSGPIASFGVEDFTPENGQVYTILASAVSADGLSCQANSTFTISFQQPMEGTAQVAFNKQTGYANILVSFPSTATSGRSVPVIASLYRDSVLLLDNVQSGATVLDRNIPCNKEVTYTVVTKSALGAVSNKDYEYTAKTPYWYAYWPNGVAKAIWDPKGSRSISRPERVLKRYSGRRWPVSYDSAAVDDSRTITFAVEDREQADAFANLMLDAGIGTFKSGDGDVFNAVFTYSDNRDFTKMDYLFGTMTIGVQRVDGEVS